MATVRPSIPDRPIELLHLVSTFEIKTDTKWLVQIARYLDPLRFRLSAVCFYKGGPMREQLESLGVRTHNLEIRDERDPRGILRAHRLIENGVYDIVHTHLLRADLFGGAAARWSGVPIILSSVYAVGEFRRSRRRRTDRILDVACATLPTHILAVSDAVKHDCLKRLKLNDEQISVIHTGIELPPDVPAEHVRAIRRQWGFDDGTPVVLAVSRLSYEKGIDTLIDAAVMLHRSHPEVRFVVVGDGPDRVQLEDMIDEMDLGGVVRLPGFLDDVRPAIAAADVFCLPSKSEGMPNALLEAMAAAKPIVATAVGGVPEAISPGYEGLLADPGDPRELANMIGLLIDDRLTAERMGRTARHTVERRFLAKDVVVRYAELYTRLFADARLARRKEREQDASAETSI